MNLQRNILASYASQFYVTLVAIVALPLYLRYLGAEAYGLVGFFTMLQAWFSLLDIGLTPTTARESARFRGGAIDASSYRRLIRALEGVFLAIALAGGGALFAAAGLIARRWLQAAALPVAEVRTAVQLMAAIVAMRWMCGLYRGVVTGCERLVWLGWFNAIVATLRFLAVLVVFVFVGTTPFHYFAYQFGVAALELAGLALYARRLMPRAPDRAAAPWSWQPLRPLLRFSLTIAFTSSVWVLLTQTDKLVLSRLLPLGDYGGYTLAVMVAGGVMLISSPVSTAIMPRMARLEAEGDREGLIRVYRRTTQLVAVVAGAASATVALFAGELLWAWTGDRALADRSSGILILYAIGNALVAVAAFPYYLQYAKGDLRLHLIGNGAFVVILIPLIIWAAVHHGGEGVGWVWLLTNLLVFVAWLPWVHRRFAPGLNLRWYLQDVLLIYLAAGAAGGCLAAVLPSSANRWAELALIAAAGALAAGAGAAASSAFWEKARALRSQGRALLAGWSPTGG